MVIRNVVLIAVATAAFITRYSVLSDSTGLASAALIA